MLAIGKPGEADPPTGAARVYVDDDHWRNFIMNAAPLCSFVVWTTGDTRGLQWEFEHLVETVSPECLLLWPHVAVAHYSARKKQADWEKFLERYQELFPKPLPRNIIGVDYLTFDRDWTPRALPNTNLRFTIWERIGSLQPVIYLRDFVNQRKSSIEKAGLISETK